MQGIYSYLGGLNSVSYLRRTTHIEGVIAHLEGVYKEVAKGVGVSSSEYRVISQNILRTQLGSLEHVISFFGVWIFAQISGSVLSLGPEFGAARILLIFTLGLAGYLIPVFVLSLLLPLQLIWNVRYWTIILATVVISAYAVSVIYIFVLGPLHPVPFGQLIMSLLLVYGVTIFVGASRISKTVSYSTYKDRQLRGGIERHLPINKSGELITMSAQDHYVSLVTDAGTHLVRMSMKDAVADTTAQQGLQVHRSHWVAYAAMRNVEKNGERWFVNLSNNMQIPVSKSKLADVKAHLSET